MRALPRTDCVRCAQQGATERFSLGAYYSRLCDPCWDAATVRKEGTEGFHPLDAGESLEAEDGEDW
jgi:hypothetical protein